MASLDESNTAEEDEEGASSWRLVPAPPQVRTARNERKREKTRRRRDFYRDPDGAPLMQRNGAGGLEVVGSDYQIACSAVDSTAMQLAHSYVSPATESTEEEEASSDTDDELLAAAYTAPRGHWKLDALFPDLSDSISLDQIEQGCSAAESASVILESIESSEARADVLHHLNFLKDSLSESISILTDEITVARVLAAIDSINVAKSKEY